MRKNKLKKAALAALLSLPALASAAGMDCGKATSAVDKALCAVPGLARRDAELNQAFQRAKTRAGSHAKGVVRDQRDWLANRNGTVLEPSTQPEDVTKLYDERIAFLDSVFKTPDSPLLAAIVAKAVATPASAGTRDARTAPLAALGGDGSVFRPSKSAFDGSFDEISKWMGARFAAGPALKRLLADAFDDDGGIDYSATVMTQDAAGVGGILVVEGTLHCENWALFGWKGRALRALPTPSLFDGGGNCWEISGDLVSFRGRVYAMRTDVGVDAIQISVQPQTSDGWGLAAGLELDYDRQLKAPTSYCALDDCGALTAQAGKAIQRYDRNGDEDELASGLSADEKKRFAAMRQQAEAAGRLTGSMPNFGDKAHIFADDTDSYSEFEDDYGSDARQAAFFPLRWHGELLLARIGHGAFAWRTSADWLLAAWRWDGKTFTPALGMQVIVQRGDLRLVKPWMSDTPDSGE